MREKKTEKGEAGRFGTGLAGFIPPPPPFPLPSFSPLDHRATAYGQPPPHLQLHEGMRVPVGGPRRALLSVHWNWRYWQRPA
jgi:hypothetical protein